MAPSAAVTMEVVFDHEIKGQELIGVIKEGLKHLFFIRRQLPLPLVILQRELSITPHREQGKPGECLGRGPRLHAKKRETAIFAIEDTLDALDDFAINRRIHSIAILFGSTVVSPKEVFLLRPEFDTLVMEKDEEVHTVTEEDSSSFAKQMDRSGRSFVKSLVTNKDLSSLGDIRPTNVFIFVLASRDTKCSISDKLLPKQNYKLPDKGKYYDIVLTDKDTVWNFPSSNKHPVDKLLDIQKQLDLIWYQTNIALKGFKEPRTSMY